MFSGLKLLASVRLLFAVGVQFFGVAAASAQDWRRLPDGRAVIVVKNMELFLPTTGADLDFIGFSDMKSHRQLSLRAAIGDPDAARELFAGAEAIEVSIVNIATNNGLFLGEFSRADLRSFRADFVVGDIKVDANCGYWERHFAELRAELTPDDARVGQSGWAEFVETKNPPSASFVRPVSDQSDPTFGGVHCDAMDTCGSSKCFGVTMAFYFQFYRKMFKQAEWQGLNKNVSSLLKFVLNVRDN